jgi:hypothetical protein
MKTTASEHAFVIASFLAIVAWIATTVAQLPPALAGASTS